MVKAILDGRKTQTRRVVKPQPDGMDKVYEKDFRKDFGGRRYPYGKPGSTLWVRECFAICPEDFKDTGGYIYRADDKYNDYVCSFEWRPSIYMPRKASRITLEITGVRVERLQDISQSDAMSEGVVGREYCPSPDSCVDPDNCGFDAEIHFEKLWNSINGKKYPWDSNPWVWVIEFKKVD